MVSYVVLAVALCTLTFLVLALLARTGRWRWRPHVNEGILRMVYHHKPVVAAHRGYSHPTSPYFYYLLINRIIFNSKKSIKMLPSCH
jgi:hypothetical protein